MQIVTKKGKEVCEKDFPVREIPNPEVYLGGVLNGSKVERNVKHVMVKYGPSVPLTAIFSIKKWTLSYGEEKVEGYGSQLDSKAQALLNEINPSGVIGLLLEVLGPDGKVRTLGASFEIID